MRALLLAALVACHPAPQQTTPVAGSPNVAALEARVATLEASNKKYAEALEFLQKVYDQQKAQADQQDRDELAPDGVFAVAVAQDVAAGQVEGPADAPVTIVKCFDFACPYCARSAPVIDAIVKKYAGKVRVVYKNLVVHPQVATTAHLASCAAAKQGKYVAYKTAIWDKGFAAYSESRGDASKLGRDAMLSFAKDLKLDLKRFEKDMDSEECKQRLTQDAADLEKFKVNSTPTFFINGTPIAGALPQEELEMVIDAKLKDVASSGVPAGQYYDKVVIGQGEKAFRSKLDKKP